MGFLEYLLLSLVAIVVGCALTLKKWFSYWKDREVPHDPPIFPYGNGKNLGKTENFADITEKYYYKFKETSPFFGIYLLFSPVAVITDLDLVKNVLVKEFHYFTNRGLYYNEKDDPLSAHLFHLDGPQWRILRTKLTPTFTSGKMKFMFPTIVDVGQHLDEVLSKIVMANPIVEIKEVLARFSTDVIGTCAFGIECNSLKDPNAEFRVQGRSVFEMQRNGPFMREVIQTFPKLARALKMKLLRDDNSKFFTNAVTETVNFRQKHNITRNDFMDILLKLKNDKTGQDSFSIEQLAAQAFLFFAAGFETSSTTMGFCLYELALNQEIQDKLRQEINEVLARHDGEFTYEAMSEMSYMEKVINETLRKYPPLSILIRTAVNDYPVPGTKYVIEKGRKVFIPAYSIQNDPSIYPNPKTFDPERFSPENIQNRHSCAFLAFGDGPRNCIGLRFGKMQTIVGLTTLIRSFKFSVSPTTQIPLKFDKKGFIFVPESGIELKIERL